MNTYKTASGDLHVINGVPPAEGIPGYEQDQANPRIFHPLWAKCAHRLTHRTFKPTCGCQVDLNKCKLKDLLLRHGTCGKCPDLDYGEPEIIIKKWGQHGL